MLKIEGGMCTIINSRVTHTVVVHDQGLEVFVKFKGVNAHRMNILMNLQETGECLQWLTDRYNREMRKFSHPRAVGTASDQAAASADTNERK